MELKRTTLGELSKGKGSYGIAASAVDYSENLYTYLRITDIKDDGTIDFNSLKSVEDDKASNYLLQPNDIVFARTGASTGRNYFYDGSDGQFVYAGFLIKFSIDDSKVNPKFIKYYCLSKVFKDWVHSFNTGSTRGNINAQTFASLPIALPSRKQQDNMVSILSSLDEKIAVNNQINNNLEELIQLLFIQKFPNITSNGGNTLKEIISFSNGKKRPASNGDIPVYGGNGILSHTSKYNAVNCVIVGRVGAYCGSLYLSTVPCWISDNAIKAESKIGYSQQFIYRLLQSLSLSNKHIGTSQPLLTQGILNTIPFTKPSDNKILEFCSIADIFQNLIDLIIIENKQLEELRDTLLPKLMSGELDVSEIEL